MFKPLKNPKILTDLAEQIVDILVDGKIEDESVRFEIGKKLFLIEKVLPQKIKHHYKILATEILKHLPDQEGISQSSLSEMHLFYKAKSLFLSKFGDRIS